MKPLVVKPSGGRSVLLGIAFVVFTLAGLAMLFSGEIMTILFGVAAILFFGVGGVFYFIRTASRATFTLDQQGLRPGNGGFVPWRDIGRVGPTTSGGARALGVEVLNVPAYLATLTDEQRQWTLRAASAGKAFGAAAGEPGLGDLPTDDLTGAMAWAKAANGGYDLAFAAMTLNGSVEKIARAVEDYRQAVGQPPAGGPQQ